MDLKGTERIDDLQYKGLKIIQNTEGFCFGIDSVILANFATTIKAGSNVVDLGTGTGILGILLCGKTNLKHVIGVEIQKEVADMAERSIALNNFSQRFSIINNDIKNILQEKIIKPGTVDVVITNPPYKEANSGVTNENKRKYISRHETTASLEDFIEVASKLLCNKGIFFMVNKPERLVDIIEKMRKHKIEPKEIKFVYPSEGKECNLVLIKGIKCASKFLKISEPLYIYDKNGGYTEKIKVIYENGGKHNAKR